MRSLPHAVRNALAQIEDAEAATALDLALARTIAGLDTEHATPHAQRAEVVALSAALVSRARRDGHSAVDLEAHAEKRFPEDEHTRLSRSLPTLPALDAWISLLEASPTVSDRAGSAPLVLEGTRLAFRRFVEAEGRLARSVASRLGDVLEDVPAAALEAFGRLFPPRDDGALDRQALAAAVALRNRLTVVAGGPGTGKTYTATRILAVLRAADPGLRIALAAPTGKAAGRLTESLEKGLPSLPPTLADLPTEAVTLHRLLGAHPDRSGLRHNARNPLVHDVVLVDEGSMIDLPMFDALLAALRPEARLVVLGDPDQLPPVEVGTTFSDLCAAGAGPLPPDAAAFAARFGLEVESSPDAPPLAGSVVTLAESRRFTSESDVGVLAVAVREGDADAALVALSSLDRLGLEAENPAGRAVSWALPFALEVVASRTPEDALERLAAFRLLAAVRRGPRGVEGLNESIEAALRASGRVVWSPYGPRVYDGRPLLVTRNDRDTGLANGDVGVCWRVEGRRVVVFPDLGAVPFERLPPHEPAWALTVHKSQGSEFEAVGVVLPEPGSRGETLLSRELLYTAATRARSSVAVFGEADAVRRAVERPQSRTGGLARALVAGT